jgi:hypothetical protein
MHESEDCSELIGIDENNYTLGNTLSEIFNKNELYYKQIYKDIYDDEIINYDQHKYVRCAIDINDSIDSGEFSSVITKIQDILIFKKKYHDDKYYQIETSLLEMLDSSGDDTHIYTNDDGIRHVLFKPELERQSNWPQEIYEYPITILFADVRSSIRSQYLCRSSMMDCLHKELLHINSNLLKLELNTYSDNIEKSPILISLDELTQSFKIEQISTVEKMTIIEKEMDTLNYCRMAGYCNENGRILKKWVPPIIY